MGVPREGGDTLTGFDAERAKRGSQAPLLWIDLLGHADASCNLLGHDAFVREAAKLLVERSPSTPVSPLSRWVTSTLCTVSTLTITST